MLFVSKNIFVVLEIVVKSFQVIASHYDVHCGEYEQYHHCYYFGSHLSMYLSNKMGSFFSSNLIISRAKNPDTATIPYL